MDNQTSNSNISDVNFAWRSTQRSTIGMIYTYDTTDDILDIIMNPHATQSRMIITRMATSG